MTYEHSLFMALRIGDCYVLFFVRNKRLECMFQITRSQWRTLQRCNVSVVR